MKRSLVLVSCIVVLGLMLSSCASAPKESGLKLVETGKLLICSNSPYPPMENLDEKGEWKGVDVDLGSEIAKRLDLKAQFVNTVWDTIIASVTSGKCDILMSSMSINPDRNKQVSFIPYFFAGQSFVAVKGNPENVNVPMDLCGKSVGAQSGTVNVDYLQGTGDYQDKGVSQECTKAGKQAVNVIVSQNDSDAYLQLQSGKVVVYATDSPVAGYYLTLPGNDAKFQLVGEVVESGPYGIAIPCGAADCSTAPLSAVGKAVDTALKNMLADGTYDTILKKWGVSNGTIKR